MHTDARHMENGSLLEGDICIVGSGAAGISMALEWMHSPYKVILLEGGGFEYEEDVQDLYKGSTTGQRYYPLSSARLHYFGGTTGHWAGFCSTLDPIDFEKRDWVPLSGWPIQKKELEPFYIRAHEKLELGPYEYEAAYWQARDPALRSLPLDASVIWNKIWQFSPPTRFGTKYRDAILRAGNIHLYTYANVVDISATENAGSVTEITTRNFAGKTLKVRAKYFVLCCCAIQNARLLLASNKQAPRGLGNDHDLVGRHFMEHVEIRSGELWLTRPDPMKLYMMDFGVTKARAELAVAAEKQREFTILNGTVSLMPLNVAKKIKPAIASWSAEDPRKSLDQYFGSISKAFKETPGAPGEMNQSFQLFTRIEQAPNPASRVTLENEKDALGMPRASLHWELTPLEKRSIRKIYELLAQQLGSAGAGRVKLLDYLVDEKDEHWPDFTGGGWHHMGTTRMHEDPRLGVVDADCRVHGISNLYVAGSSCFTTAGAVNPTLSIVALTLRLSDHLKQKIKT